MRTEEIDIPWANGATAKLRIRMWSYRERDMWERKWRQPGEIYVGGLIGALGGPKSGGMKGVQLARALVDDQRVRFDKQGSTPTLEKVALVLEEVVIPGDGVRTRLGAGNPEAAVSWREWIEGLDADLFDRIAMAVDDILSLRDDEKKTSTGSGPVSPSETPPTRSS